MNNPVFLTSSTFSQMPIGSLNQWQAFYHTASFELEADTFIPILWLMLFRQNNLYWAKYTDLLDINDEGNLDDLAEFHDTFGESAYAYLVIDQQQALANLAQRKLLFINTFGSENIYHFEYFQSLIELHFPQHILLRASSLSLNLDDADFLLEPLVRLENFQQDQINLADFAEIQHNDLARFDNHSNIIYGVDNNTETNALKNDAIEYANESDNSSTEQHTPMTDINKPQALPPSKSSTIAIWICTFIVATLTITVWYFTHSILYAVIVFLVSAFVLGFISSKLGHSE